MSKVMGEKVNIFLCIDGPFRGFFGNDLFIFAIMFVNPFLARYRI